jgi:hypothetical protein
MLAVLMSVGAAAVLGFLAVGGPILVDRVRMRRTEAAARQIALTDALDGRLGPILAPVVRRRPWGTWEIQIAAPFLRPAVVATVLAVVDELFAGGRTDSRSYRVTLQTQNPGSDAGESTKPWASAA